MKNLLLFLIFGLILKGDQVDEMEELILNHESLIIHPEKLYKDGGIWLTETQNIPFTGRVEIYAEEDKENKILECTIVDGRKHGIFIQYLNMSKELPGIIGLYMMDEKEGGWATTEPVDGWQKSPINMMTIPLKSTYISYRDGLRDGVVRISDLLSGRYDNDKKSGIWYFFMDTANKDLWTVKHEYEEDVLIDSECRELIKGGVFDMDCDTYNMKYPGSEYILRQLDPKLRQVYEEDLLNRFVIKDVNGMDVEIIVDEFLDHINYYHKRKISIHKERGYSFNINDDLRTLLINQRKD